MSWQIYLAISVLLISFNGLFHRSLLKDDESNPQAQAVIFLGIGGLAAIVIAFLNGNLNLSIPPNLFWNFLLLILLLTPAYFFRYRAFQLIGASEVAMFAVTGRLWNVVGAHFFLNEAITLKMIIGAVVILIGVMLTRYEKRKFTINRGVVYVLIGAFFFGMGDINGYFILQNYDSTNFLIYASLLPVLAFIILQPGTLKKLKYYFQKDRAIKVLLLCFCDVFGTLAAYRAYQIGRNASVIGPLRAMSVVVTVILATLILKERDNVVNKFVGALISVAGVSLLL